MLYSFENGTLCRFKLQYNILLSELSHTLSKIFFIHFNLILFCARKRASILFILFCARKRASILFTLDLFYFVQAGASVFYHSFGICCKQFLFIFALGPEKTGSKFGKKEIDEGAPHFLGNLFFLLKRDPPKIKF